MKKIITLVAISVLALLSTNSLADPNPQPPAAIENNQDSDRDGVPDFKDECPQSAPGVHVDSTGCTLKAAPAYAKSSEYNTCAVGNDCVPEIGTGIVKGEKPKKGEEKTSSGNPKPAAKRVVQPWNEDLIKFLTLAILGSFLVCLLAASILLYRVSASGLTVLKVFSLLIVVVMSSLLVVVGYDDRQLAPVFGLFGAIAGYILGKDSEKSD